MATSKQPSPFDYHDLERGMMRLVYAAADAGFTPGYVRRCAEAYISIAEMQDRFHAKDEEDNGTPS